MNAMAKIVSRPAGQKRLITPGMEIMYGSDSKVIWNQNRLIQLKYANINPCRYADRKLLVTRSIRPASLIPTARPGAEKTITTICMSTGLSQSQQAVLQYKERYCLHDTKKMVRVSWISD